MNKKRLLLIVSIVGIAFLVIVIYPSIVREMNRRTFLSNVARLEDGDIVKLKELATFEWDKMYIILPYGGRTSVERFEKRYSLHLRSTVNLIPYWPPFPSVYLLFINDNRQVAGILSDREFFMAPSIRPLSFCFSDDNYFVAGRSAPESNRVTLSKR